MEVNYKSDFDFVLNLVDASGTEKGIETSESDSFESMAESINGISAGKPFFLTKLGYPDDDTIFDEDIAYSLKLKEKWENGEITDFISDKRLRFLPLIDTSTVTSFSYFFNSCTALTTILQLDTANVTDMSNMFSYCTSLTTIPQLDTANVTNMSSMFFDCSSLATIPQLDTSNVTDMGSMFSHCTSLTTIPQLDTANVTNMNSMFYNCSALTTIPQLDTANVEYMSYMFSGCSKLVNMLLKNLGKSSLTSWDLSSAANWGTGSTENRQSLIDTLITYSYDRAANGMSTCTIKLSSTTKALLTEEEIAQITAKGFTIS